jgi:replicative DNA helicase
MPTDVALERGLPANLDAERFVLGSCLIDEAEIDRVRSVITDEAFSLAKHRSIFRCMIDLRDRGQRVDRVTVAHLLMERQQLEACDGLGYLVELDNGLPSIFDPASYIGIVDEMWRRRRLIISAQRIIDRTLMGDVDSQQLINEASSNLLELGTKQDDTGFLSAKRIAELDGIDRIIGPQRHGTEFGIRELDELTLGMHDGELIVVCARPAMGKTAFALSVAGNVVLHRTRPKVTAILTLEMHRDAIFRRLACQRAAVDLQKVRKGTCTADERRRLQNAMIALTESPLYIDDNPVSDLAGLIAKLRKIRAEAGSLGLIIVDYLQLMKSARYAGNRVQEVSEVSRGLKVIAKMFRCPVMALSQLSRDPEKRSGDDKKPKLADLRESGSIEQDADMVVAPFRPEVYDRERDDLKGKAYAIVLKQREGPLGEAEMVYVAPYTLFANPVSAFDEGMGFTYQ